MAKKKTDREIINDYVKRGIQLSSSFDNFSAGVNTTVKDFHKTLMDDIVKDLSGPMTAKRIDEIANDLRKEINRFYKTEVNEPVYEGSEMVISSEIKWNTAQVASVNEMIKPKELNSKVIAKKALMKTYQGHTFKYWFNANSDTEWLRVAKQLKDGYIHGKTTPEIVREVEKIFTKSEQYVKTLTRSYLQHSAMEARYATLDSLDAVVGYVWNATLDSRTTPHICGIRDGHKYDKDGKPLDGGLPWDAGPGRIHFNCRSSSIPILRDAPNLAEEYSRPAINAGKEYESGDNKTNRGTPRKPTKPNIEKGIFKVVQVKKGTVYEGWLKSQKTDYIGDIVGKENAVAFKKGEITLADITRSKNTNIKDL